jgi:hypothetical protein
MMLPIPLLLLAQEVAEFAEFAAVASCTGLLVVVVDELSTLRWGKVLLVLAVADSKRLEEKAHATATITLKNKITTRDMIARLY